MLPGIPSKVQAAQGYLWHCYSIENHSEDFAETGRYLEDKEYMVKQSALDVLHLYFLGEEDYTPLIVELQPPQALTPLGGFVAVPR